MPRPEPWRRRCSGRDDTGFLAGGARVPTGRATYPAEIAPTPRLRAERIFTNIARWTDMPSGRRFPAFAQPQAFVAGAKLTS